MKTKVYFNLTRFFDESLPLVYFRSTDVEQGNWDRLLWSVPDEMLFLLSKGYRIIVLDKTSNRVGKIEKIFIPVLADLLNYIYKGLPLQNRRLKPSFLKAINTLKSDKKLYRKYMFWKKFFLKDKKRLCVFGVSQSVKKEEIRNAGEFERSDL